MLSDSLIMLADSLVMMADSLMVCIRRNYSFHCALTHSQDEINLHAIGKKIDQLELVDTLRNKKSS